MLVVLVVFMMMMTTTMMPMMFIGNACLPRELFYVLCPCRFDRPCKWCFVPWNPSLGTQELTCARKIFAQETLSTQMSSGKVDSYLLTEGVKQAQLWSQGSRVDWCLSLPVPRAEHEPHERGKSKGWLSRPHLSQRGFP